MTHSIQISEFNSHDVITQVNNQLITTSKLVAETFGKLHKNIIQKIESLECSDEFTSANFSAYVQDLSIGNGATRKSKIFNITKDGFMFLVMGFTGKKAARIKEAYINAFNDMENHLFQPKIKTLSFYQANHIKSVVGKIGLLTDNGISPTYQAIRERFDVTSFQHIPAKRYTELCEFLSCEPLTGELLEAEQLSIQEKSIIQCADFNKRKTSLHYLTMGDMMDCGWHLQLNQLLSFLQKHQGKPLYFGELSGLKQEINSLCYIVERQEQKLGIIKQQVN